MEIKSKVFKRKSSDSKQKGKWIARVSYFDDVEGRMRTLERSCGRRSDAIDERDRLVAETGKSFGQSHVGDRMTFSQLADKCEQAFYKPAEIVEGRKIAGVRSIESVLVYIKTLKAYFGPLQIKSITTESLTSYKIHRTKPKGAARPVKIATVNRELSIMRKMMRFALQKGWIFKDIFFNAKVIEASSEIARTRLLSRDEEERLLASCSGERFITYQRKGKDGTTTEVNASVSADNPHLKAMILMAIDSGMRRGEIFKLRWKDVDFQNNLIRVVGTHTKTEQERVTPLSARTKAELITLRTLSPDVPFPFASIKRSFGTAKRIAGIDDLRFHDLRRTAVTRWLSEGVSLAFAGKFAGHSQLQTTVKHYAATDLEAIQRVNDLMNISHGRESTLLSSAEYDHVN